MFYTLISTVKYGDIVPLYWHIKRHHILNSNYTCAELVKVFTSYIKNLYKIILITLPFFKDKMHSLIRKLCYLLFQINCTIFVEAITGSPCYVHMVVHSAFLYEMCPYCEVDLCLWQSKLNTIWHDKVCSCQITFLLLLPIKVTATISFAGEDDENGWQTLYNTKSLLLS